jgi:hypothetical protein
MPPDELDPQTDLSPGSGDVNAEQQPDASSATDSSGAQGDSPTPKPGDESQAKGETKPKSVFELAKAALEKTRVAAAAAADQAGESPTLGEAGTEGADKTGAAAAGDGGEGNDYEPVKTPKTAAEKRLNELLTERKTYKPQAEHYQQLQQWITGNSLTPELVTTSLGVAALSKRAQDTSDPEVAKQALEALEPVRQQLQAIAGIIERLPDDLRTKVDDGILSETEAGELARLRLRDQVQTEALRANREREETNRQRSETSNAIAVVSGAINAWEQSVAKSDPDFSKKRSFVVSKLHEVWAKEGPARDAAGAVDQAKRAMKAVNDEMRSVLPARREVNTQTTGSSPRNVGVKPKNSFEAAKARLNGQRVSY